MKAVGEWESPSKEAETSTWSAAADALAVSLANLQRALAAAEQELRHTRTSYERLRQTGWGEDETVAMLIHRLTLQEQRIAFLVGLGKSNREVAALSRVSVDTVKSHMKSILHKLRLRSRWQLQGMLPSGEHGAPGIRSTR